jgi:hypothetical protein
MRKHTALVGLTLVAFGAAACTGSPTSADLAGVRPRFDGGVFGGSGNFTGPAPANTTATGTEVTAADSVTARGGVFGGSGN